MSFGGERIHVHEGTDVFAFIGAQCEAIVDDDPETNPVDPVAVGTGRLTFHSRIDSDGVEHVTNSVIGKVDRVSDGKHSTPARSRN